MIPVFHIEGGLELAAARGISVCGLVAAAGGIFYSAALRPAGLPAPLTDRLRRLGRANLLFAILAALLWLAAETRDLAGDAAPADVWTVLASTLFGHLLAARVLLLLVALGMLQRRSTPVAAVPALLALALQAGHSHALAMGGSPVLLASSVLHLLAAGVWLGGLPALWLVIGEAPAGTAHAAAMRFSRAGVVCVAILLVTASWQFGRLVVNVAGLVGTAYGWVAGVKIALFTALLAVAANSRQRLTPRIGTRPARDALRVSILLEIGLGVAILLAAGVLTELQPAMHTQKLWPFPFVPSLEAAREDPDVAREAMLAAGALAICVIVLTAAILLRRHRWAAAGAGLAASFGLALSVPHFSPLFVPAVPTVFYRSPTGFTATSIMQGAALYPAHCAACHGAGGRGDGPAGGTLAEPPADLTAPHLWMHEDGELFWWLSHGIEGPRGGLVMPGFAALLSEEERWSLIDFIRARNAGDTLGSGGWATKIQAPDFPVTCARARLEKLSDLRGGEVQVTLAAGTGPGASVTSVIPVPAGPATPDAGCHAEDPGIAAAYAVVAPGSRSVLIDANGWLRAASGGKELLDPRLAAMPLPRDRPSMPMEMPPGMKM